MRAAEPIVIDGASRSSAPPAPPPPPPALFDDADAPLPPPPAAVISPFTVSMGVMICSAPPAPPLGPPLLPPLPPWHPPRSGEICVSPLASPPAASTAPTPAWL